MKNKTIKKIIIVLLWLLIWQLLSLIINNPVMLVGPTKVLWALFRNLISPDFYLRAFRSFAMILTGFLSAFIVGELLAVLSYKFSLIEDFLHPFMLAVKSVPVASFVVILLIWFGSLHLSVYISFLIVLPNVYVPTLEGLAHHNKDLKNLAQIHGMSRINQAKFIYWPAIYPYLVTGLKTGIGMAWKSGIAAEVIGMSKNTLGERIYISKVYLETDQLFACTIMVILFCFIFEKMVLRIINFLGNYHFSSSGIKRNLSKDCLPVFDKVSKSYGDQALLENLTIDFTKDRCLMLLSPSGQGKTTVFKLMTGLENEDCGNIKVPAISIAFQEEIFLEKYTALENLRIFAKESLSLKEIDKLAAKILPADSLCKPVEEFSGGMKRRLSVLRALLSDSVLLLLDEPFSGLDEDNKILLANLIMELKGDRYLVYTGHYEKDAELLEAERISLWKHE